MTNKTLKELMYDSRKGVEDSTNGLARLFRTVLYDLDIRYESFSDNINRYLQRQSVGKPDVSNKERSRERGNLVKELSGNNLTFKNFIKALQILNPVSVELTLTMKWRRGTETVHTVNMNIYDPNNPENKGSSSCNSEE